MNQALGKMQVASQHGRYRNPLQKLYKGLELVGTYASLNLKAEARKTYLGYLWWVIEPLLYVAVFYFVFNVVLKSNRGDFLLFLICGKVPFLWISKSINNSAGSILQNKAMLTQANIQPLLFPMVVLQENLYKQLPVFLLLLVLAYVLSGDTGWSWLWLLPVITTTYLLIIPLSLMGALITSFVPDMRMVLQLCTLFLLFISGIFWDIRAVDPVLQQYMMLFNPVAFLIDAYRSVLIYGERPHLVHLTWLSMISLIALAFVCWLYIALRSAINSRVISE